MKAIIALLFLSMFDCLCAQEKIDGIGKFKIGKTNISVISELQKELDIPIKRMVSDSDYFASCRNQDDYVLYEAVTDTTTLKNRPYFTDYPGNCKFYFLSKYTVDGFLYTHIQFLFQNGILVQLQTDGGRKLEKTMRSKYGRPRVIKSPTVGYYREGNGPEIEFSSKHVVSIWSNDSISGRSAKATNYIKPAAFYGYLYFEVSNDSTMLHINEEERKIHDRIVKREGEQ